MKSIGEVTKHVSTWNPARAATSTVFDYIDLSAVDNIRKEIVGVAQVRSDEAPSRARQLVAAGDVLVSTVRPNLNAVAVVPAALDGATASTGFTVLRPRNDLDGRYLFHWVRTRTFIEDMVRKATGASYPAVSDRVVKSSEMPLPDLGEQRRIAAILDRVDDLRAKRRQVVAYLEELARSVFLDTFGQPIIPKPTWPRVALGDLARIIRGASPRPAGDPRYFGGEIPWLKISDITATPGRIVTTIKEGVTEAGRAKSVLLPPQTLVLTNSATVGVPKIIGPETCIHDGFLAFLDLDRRVDQIWLYAALLVSRERLVALAPEGTQKNLNGPIVKAIEISLPPIDVQRAFVSRLVALESVKISAVVGAGRIDDLSESLQATVFNDFVVSTVK